MPLLNFLVIRHKTNASSLRRSAEMGKATGMAATDGLSEAMNGRSELFGEMRLRDIVESVEGLTSEEIKERILGEIKSFVGDAAPHDDMTLVVLKVR